MKFVRALIVKNRIVYFSQTDSRITDACQSVYSLFEQKLKDVESIEFGAKQSIGG